MTKEGYTGKDIQVLEGLEGVRRRPSMYIGSTSKEGLHHLIYEAVDNSVDEALAGVCKNITVSINKDGSASIEDDGRGIPVDMHPQYKVPAVQIALTKLHAGGKFDKKSYEISGGLHGVGISVVNALSKKLVAEIKREGKIYRQEYARGDVKTKLEVAGKYAGEATGTKVTFWPDETIFSTVNFDYKVLETRFREITFLNPGLKIILMDEIKGKRQEFFSSGGLIEFVKWMNDSKEVLHKPIYFKKDVDKTIIEVAIQYNSGYQENIFGFVNTINTVEGGTHVSGFKTAVTRVINDYAKKTGMLKNGNSEEGLTGEDVREGLTAIISIKIAEPQFEGQTKTKLGNSEVKGFVDSAVTASLSEFFEENPPIAKRITLKALESAKARLAAKKAKDLIRRKNAFSLGGLPGKLADCSSKKTENTEVYIVEGESAGGCFSGDTEIALADGRNLSFIEIINEKKQGKEHFCYTIKSNGSVGIEKIENPRLTKKNAEVIKIILDNGEEIICTSDHKFMLRNGEYKEAKDLTKEDSLMPLYRKISKIGGRITIEGYEMVLDTNRKWIFTHMLSDEYNLKTRIYEIAQGDVRHHIDFNKRNNNPINIVRLPKEQHLILHTEHLEKTLHRQDVKEKTKLAHLTTEYKEKMSNWAKMPEVNKIIRENSKKQWQNQEYKDFMSKKFVEFYNSNEDYRIKNNELLNGEQKKYWQNPENRRKASQKVRKFFEENPDAKEYLSNLAKEQWKDEALIIWRRQKTSEQWTPKFREKRRKSYDKTYYNKTIKLMKVILETEGNLKNFDKIRIKNKDNSILSMKTFCGRFFSGDSEKMIEVVNNWNHKIKKIEWQEKKIDVYDIEVPKTHNFALASGIFVHNSAKMARDKENQAILPLKGKILNVEKSSPIKALSSEEITNMITVIGTGVGEQFNPENLRYGKIIIMTDADVDGEHIKTLLLTFFFRFMPQLIENGNVHVALPPLYRIRKGQKDIYVYTDEELKRATSDSGASEGAVTRFKGLGEMNSQQLWDTTMNPKTRKLKKIFIEDAIEADKVFSMLMGDDVPARKQFIQDNAREAQLDI
jgi:DNA gyrase subunit B